MCGSPLPNLNVSKMFDSVLVHNLIVNDVIEDDTISELLLTSD